MLHQLIIQVMITKWYSVSSIILLHGGEVFDLVRDAIIYSVTFAINDFLEYGEKKLVFVCVKHSPNQKDLEKTNEDSNFFFKSNNISAVRIAYMMQLWTKEKNVAMKVLKYMYVYMQRTSVDNEISYCINFICTVYESDAVVKLITL